MPELILSVNGKQRMVKDIVRDLRAADEIRVSLTPPDRARLSRVQAPDPAAYLAYAKGRFLWNRRTEQDIVPVGYFVGGNGGDGGHRQCTQP
jgi:hypothetical protein